MHYVRLLRPPVVESERKQRVLRLVLTVTTDLGDSFFAPSQPVRLSVLFRASQADGSHKSFQLSETAPTGKDPYPVWRTGMRVLKLQLTLPSEDSGMVLVTPSIRRLSAMNTTDVLSSPQGLIMPVYFDLPRPGEDVPHVAFRSLKVVQNEQIKATVEIEEEIRESIARHVWDGGVVAVSLAAELCFPTVLKDAPARMATLSDIIAGSTRLNILELGSGVGIFGIGLAHILGAKGSPQADNEVSILVTDLPEAEERALANIARYHSATTATPSRVSLKYENLDWEEGRLGQFSTRVESTPWHLIAVIECIYNVDMLPTLIQTISAIQSQSTRRSAEVGSIIHVTRVLLATKPRHPSEKAVLGLMSGAGWSIEEQTTLPLPVLNAEPQSVEVYLFRKG